MIATNLARLLGYSDRLTVRAGESIEFKISAAAGVPYSAQLVRLINGDTQSDHADFKEIEISDPVNGDYTGRYQAVLPGSCVVVKDVGPIGRLDSFTLGVRVVPTLLVDDRQHLFGRWDTRSHTGWSLVINEQGYLAFIINNGQGGVCTSVTSEQVLKLKQWYQVSVRVDGNANLITLDCEEIPLTPIHVIDTVVQRSSTKLLQRIPATNTPLVMAAAFGGYDSTGRVMPEHCFNGRLEAPFIYKGVLTDIELAGVSIGECPMALLSRLIAHWDFSLGMDGTTIQDCSSNQLNGTTHNLPLRAVKSCRWDGSVTYWKERPSHYAAIHFHCDDLYDCGWLTDITYDIPDQLRSGIYALRLRQGESEDYIPFFVGAPKNKPQSKLAFIVPTYTYMAYGNVQQFETQRKRANVSKKSYYSMAMSGPGTEAYATCVDQFPDIGGSTYDLHPDGSPIHYSSWLRPLLNMRPKSILWTFCADMLYIDWLEEKNLDYDIITDDLLEQEGVSLLEKYTVVMSGNHPEYPTTKQLDAIQTYLSRGGRFMYMGGNGYYWRSAVHKTLPGVIEVRRGLTGTGTWKSEPGETYLSFTGEQGGLLRDSGYPPQQLFGVGFIAEGNGPSYYRVQPESRQGRAAFVFHGVDGDVVGDFGIFGGAAGQEIDQANTNYGTPGNTIILARSENHSECMLYVIEEMEGNIPIPLHYQSKVYADMVFFDTPNNGAVFSVGSMAWCGSLSHNNHDNNVSTITENVIRRFMDENPFADGPY